MGRLDVSDPIRDEDLHGGTVQNSSVRERLSDADSETLLDIAEAAHVVANALEASLARDRLPRRESLRTFVDVLRAGLTTR